MVQAISTIKAANEGIEAITSFVEQAKAVATSALDTTDGASRAESMKQFNAIRTQIDQLAKDSGYKGINLLQDDDLTVTFNEGRTNQLKIEGVSADTTGIGLVAADWGTKIAAADITGAKLMTNGTVTEAVAQYGIVKVAIDSTNFEYYQYTGDAIAAPTSPATAAVDQNKLTKLVKVGDDYYNLEDTHSAAGSQTADKIQDSITKATDAIVKLREFSSAFGNNYSIVQTRESFTTNLINVLEEGADKLTLADMNEESANMLALQTRQQLAINSLSLASQASQSVLKLFS
jgi:flagellin-like hook-associated protein FlgL